jgi:hypothetical protein
VTLNVIGTADKITVSADALTIASTYVGQTSITTLGTIATGTWEGTTVAVNQGGTGLASYTAGDVIYASGATTLAKLAKGSDTEVLTLASGVPTWAAPTVGDITGVTAGTGLSGGGTSGTVTLNVEASQTQITSVGALGAGSISSGFGAIDVGSSSIDGGTITGTFSGNITGNVTGNCSGSAGSATGNAATATALATARAINGTDFDGTAAITVTAAAGTVTGATLNSGVTASSLTSLGTIDSFSATGALTTIYQAVNSGNPEFKFGSSAAECLRIQTVYDGSAQTLNYVAFDTAAASATADKGEIRFTVDGDASGTSTVKFQDGGVDIAGALDVTGSTTLTGALTADAGITMTGTTPTLTIGDAGTEDTAIVFDGAAQDYYIGLDDTDDVFKIGRGSAVGTTYSIIINPSGQIAFNNDNHTSDYSFSGSDDAITMNIGSPMAATNDWNGLAFGNITNPKAAVFFKRTATYNRGNVVICLNSEANTNNVSLADEDDVVAIFAYDKNTSLLGDCAVTGELTAGTKTFRIDHPLADKKDTHQLVHSCIEGPKADLIYRGTVDLSGGSAQVDLDEAVGMSEGTFEVLCRDVQCWIQNDSGWSGVRGSVSGNLLTIECKDSVSDDTVSWMVVAERCDPHIMEAKSTDEDGRVIVEPEKESPLEPDGD